MDKHKGTEITPAAGVTTNAITTTARNNNATIKPSMPTASVNSERIKLRKSIIFAGLLETKTSTRYLEN